MGFNVVALSTHKKRKKLILIISDNKIVDISKITLKGNKQKRKEQLEQTIKNYKELWRLIDEYSE